MENIFEGKYFKNFETLFVEELNSRVLLQNFYDIFNIEQHNAIINV
jgi:hypothetical protein